jgi:maltooligosyltrehalose trehalohydrolase
MYRRLLEIRHRAIVPRLSGAKGRSQTVLGSTRRVIIAQWVLGDGSALHLIANLDGRPAEVRGPPIYGELLFSTEPAAARTPSGISLPPWFVAWHLRPAH